MFGRGMIYWRLTLCSGSEWECGGGGGRDFYLYLDITYYIFYTCIMPFSSVPFCSEIV